MLTHAQVTQLLKPINPARVAADGKGHAHVPVQEISAHLNRVFGFGNWDKEIIELRQVAEYTRPGKNAVTVTYLCSLRLTIRDPEGNVLCRIEDAATGTSPNLPDLGDAHDFAIKTSVSYALKRCAKDLGDQFGLGLYNKGSLAPIVKSSMVMPEAPAATEAQPVPVDVQADVPQAQLEEADTPEEEVVVPVQATSTENLTMEPGFGEDAPAVPGIAKNQTILIHSLARQLGLDEATYRRGLVAITGKDSSKDMTRDEAQAVIDRLSAKVGANAGSEA